MVAGQKPKPRKPKSKKTQNQKTQTQKHKVPKKPKQHVMSKILSYLFILKTTSTSDMYEATKVNTIIMQII